MITGVANPSDFYTTIKEFNEKELKYGVKALDQNERKKVISLIERIKTSKNGSGDFASVYEKKLASRVIEKISSSNKSLHNKSSFIMRIWKGFLNLIGLRISSRNVIEKIEGRRLDQDDLEKVLKELKAFQKDNPGKKIKLIDFLKEKGYAARLKDLNFAIEGLTVTAQTRIPFGKPPAWGSDIFKNIDVSGVTFRNCQFQWVNFSGSDFNDAIFEKCDFRYSVHAGSVFNQCKFRNSNLGMSCFEGTLLKGQLSETPWLRILHSIKRKLRIPPLKKPLFPEPFSWMRRSARSRKSEIATCKTAIYLMPSPYSR